MEGSSSVMFVIDVLSQTGGAERSLHLLAHGLREKGYRIIICCLKGGELSKKMAEEGYIIENLGLTRIYDFRGIKGLCRMIRIAKRERVSVIMTYHESSDFLGLIISILTRIPIISSRRDMGFKLEKRHIWTYRIFNTFFDHVATVSSAVKEVIVKTQGLKPSHVTVISNGVDLIPVKTSSSEKGSDEKSRDGFLNVCSLANIRSIKGQEYLIEAADIVVKQLPSTRFFLVGKCDFDKPYYARIQNRITELGLENVIRFTGEMPPFEIPSLLNSMDISVSSSLSEGMSNALLESMAIGKPLVATAVGGNVEVVENGKTGYLVPPGDPQAMAEALLKLLMNPEIRYEMGMQGKYCVESKFSVNRMVERYEDLMKYVFLKKKRGKWHPLSFHLKRMNTKIKSWAKISISSIMYYSGFIAAFLWVKSLLKLGEVKILCFHDISEVVKGRSIYSIFIPSEFFTKFLNFLAQKYKIVSLGEALRLLESGSSLTNDVFALTFDDSYKGWINHVLPECQRLRVPLSVFLATFPLDSNKPLLYDALVFLAENTWRKAVDLSSWQLGIFLLNDPDDIFDFVEKLHEYWRGRKEEERNHFLQELSEYLGVPLDPKKFEKILINWDDVHTMDKHGVTIGAHSVSHPFLPELEEAECFREVVQSKERLEEELGHSVSFFAYPYGGFDNGSSNTTKIVERAGFRNAFTLKPKDRNSFLPFEIGRRSVSQGMFIGPDGKFCKSILSMELSGLGDLVFGRWA